MLQERGYRNVRSQQGSISWYHWQTFYQQCYNPHRRQVQPQLHFNLENGTRQNELSEQAAICHNTDNHPCPQGCHGHAMIADLWNWQPAQQISRRCNIPHPVNVLEPNHVDKGPLIWQQTVWYQQKTHHRGGRVMMQMGGREVTSYRSLPWQTRCHKATEQNKDTKEKP